MGVEEFNSLLHYRYDSIQIESEDALLALAASSFFFLFPFCARLRVLDRLRA
jgi:hypothetical protein